MEGSKYYQLLFIVILLADPGHNVMPSCDQFPSNEVAQLCHETNAFGSRVFLDTSKVEESNMCHCDIVIDGYDKCDDICRYSKFNRYKLLIRPVNESSTLNIVLELETIGCDSRKAVYKGYLFFKYYFSMFQVIRFTLRKLHERDSTEGGCLTLEYDGQHYLNLSCHANRKPIASIETTTYEHSVTPRNGDSDNVASIETTTYEHSVTPRNGDSDNDSDDTACGRDISGNIGTAEDVKIDRIGYIVGIAVAFFAGIAFVLIVQFAKRACKKQKKEGDHTATNEPVGVAENGQMEYQGTDTDMHVASPSTSMYLNPTQGLTMDSSSPGTYESVDTGQQERAPSTHDLATYSNSPDTYESVDADQLDHTPSPQGLVTESILPNTYESLEEGQQEHVYLAL